MERDDFALDGLLRELARASEGEDRAFVDRVLARTRRRPSRVPAMAAAAAILIAVAAALAIPVPPATGRIDFSGPACLVPDATRMRLLMKDPASGRLLLLGETPIGAAVRVPADTPLLLQAVGADGLARWTAPHWTRVRATPPDATPQLDRKAARAVDFANDAKPILDRHCGGCHADSELLRSSVKPFEARRSPLVTQTHAPLPDADRLQLARWVDLGAVGRP